MDSLTHGDGHCAALGETLVGCVFPRPPEGCPGVKASVEGAGSLGGDHWGSLVWSIVTRSEMCFLALRLSMAPKYLQG